MEYWVFNTPITPLFHYSGSAVLHGVNMSETIGSSQRRPFGIFLHVTRQRF
jgi:hypothetical protein